MGNTLYDAHVLVCPPKHAKLWGRMVCLSNNVFPHVRLLCNFLEQKGAKRACSVMLAPRRSLSDDSVGLDSFPSPAGKPLPALLDTSPVPIAALPEQQPDNGTGIDVSPILAIRSAGRSEEAMVGCSESPSGPSGIDSVIAQCLEVMGGTRAPATKAVAKGKAKAKAKAMSVSAVSPKAKAQAKATAKAEAKGKGKAAGGKKTGAPTMTRPHVKSSSTADLPTKVQLPGGKWARLGCPKCRGGRFGCVQCRNPLYSGNRWTKSA